MAYLSVVLQAPKLREGLRKIDRNELKVCRRERAMLLLQFARWAYFQTCSLILFDVNCSFFYFFLFLFDIALLASLFSVREVSSSDVNSEALIILVFLYI